MVEIVVSCTRNDDLVVYLLEDRIAGVFQDEAEFCGLLSGCHPLDVLDRVGTNRCETSNNRFENFPWDTSKFVTKDVVSTLTTNL